MGCRICLKILTTFPRIRLTATITYNEHGKPVSKEPSPNPISSTKETDNRDQLFSRSDLINVANEVFGNAKWNHAVTNQTLDFVEYVTGKYHVGCAAFVKVQLEDGSFHEDLGYSNTEGSTKGLAIFSARTSSITNALKNTLLCFGGAIAMKIKNYVKFKLNESNSVISAIGEPQIIVIPKPRAIAPPQAQSTPQKTRPSSISNTAGTIENNKPADTLVKNNNERKLLSPAPIKTVENGAQVSKAVLTEEEKRLERKRRQAQKQEEYRLKLLKEMESTDKPNARF